MIRKANINDIDKIWGIYDEILTLEEQGPAVAGWVRGSYPTVETARTGLENDELFVLEIDGQVVGSMILNKRQDAHYPLGKWQYDADDEEVMVLHSFVVSPSHARKGYGEMLFKFYEEYAVENGCKYLRFSTNATNYRSRNFYRKMNVTEACELEREIRGKKGYSILFEKKL